VIFGIGIDVQGQRMADMRARYGARLEQRLLLPQEQEQYAKAKRKDRFLAMHFAAKEAIVKAMGTGFAHGVWIRDVGTVANALGRPEVIYSARGDKKRRELGIGEGHVSLTDEAGLIVAVAVLMRAAPARRRRVADRSTKR
jgi:holo-[acyl-carrier protein] synthase